jgi:hypothetical protein
MRKTITITAITVLLSLSAATVHAQQPPTELLLRMTLQNEMRTGLSQDDVTTPDVDLQLYGDGENIVVATGTNAYLPRLFFGLCQGPCGLTLRDRNNRFDLTGRRAKMRVTSIVSAFHEVQPLIRTGNGTLLVCDRGVGSTADWHQDDISFSDCRWWRVDGERGVTLGGSFVDADLTQVEEVGYIDLIPGSGAWEDESLPVEEQPPPPAGGWIAVSDFEVLGVPVSR